MPLSLESLGPNSRILPFVICQARRSSPVPKSNLHFQLIEKFVFETITNFYSRCPLLPSGWTRLESQRR